MSNTICFVRLWQLNIKLYAMKALYTLLRNSCYSTSVIYFTIFKKIYFFVVFIASVKAFSSCREQGLLLLQRVGSRSPELQ